MVGIVLGIYIGTILLLNIPYIQHRMSLLVADELGKVLQSELVIGRIDIGLLNRIIVDDLLLEDRSGKDMLRVARLSAKFDILPLFEGKISISNVQLYGFDINLNKPTPGGEPNFRFVFDAFAPKDTLRRKSPLDLRINSILIRRGRVSYHVLSENYTPGKFNPNHIGLRNIIANISLKALQPDSINVAVKRMSVEEEHSGFALEKLNFKLVGNNRGARVEDFAIGLPHSKLEMDTIRVAYDSLSLSKDQLQNARVSFRMLPSRLVLQDLSAFVPAFASFNEELQMELEANGTLDQLECPHILLYSSDRHFRLSGNISLQDLTHPSDIYVYGNLSNLYADRAGVEFFVRNLGRKGQGVPPVLERLGTVSFRGQVSGYFTDLVMYGRTQTDLGEVNTDIKLSSDREKGWFAYSGAMHTHDFELGKALGNDKLGRITFNVDVDGNHREGQYPAITMAGLVSALDYSGYTYHNISLDGEYRQGGFNGKVELDDVNGAVRLNGFINASSSMPTFNFLAEIEHFRPHDLNLTRKFEDTEFSVKVKADFTGGTLDEMNGVINVDSLLCKSPDRSYFLDNIKVEALEEPDERQRLVLTSDFMDGTVEGNYSYRTLPVGVQNILRRYVPTLLPQKGRMQQTDNDFRFNLHIYNTEVLSDMFQLPVKVYTHSTLAGAFNDKAGRMRVEGYFPRLRYGNRFIESAMVLCENPDDRLHALARLTNRRENSAVNVSVEANAHEDQVVATLNWGNNGLVTYSGKLAARTRFIRQEALSDSTASGKKAHVRKRLSTAPLKTLVDIQRTSVIVNDTLWEIHPSQVRVDSGKVHIDNFYFSHGERHLRIHGTLSKSAQDTVRMDLQDINIGYVFDIADLGVNFQGEATGPAFACGVLDTSVMSTDLFIRNFGLNDGLLGDAQIHGEWHHQVKGIYMDARIREGDIARTRVQGYIYPIKPNGSLDLHIDADNTNMRFIHYFMRNITSDFSGRVKGKVHFYGRFKALAMEGNVVGDASMKVDVLNTTYNIRDSILITPDGLTFRNNRVFDTQGHEGRVSGYLRYQHFKHLEYNFNFNVNNMLVMNTKESPDYPFYGTVYATGSATIAGNERDGVNIDVGMTTNRNTTFTYIKDQVTSAASNQFIHFVDKTPRRAVRDTLALSGYERDRQSTTAQEGNADIRLNLAIDATPEATMRIVMDPAAGDYISGRGSGNIRTEFYNKGDVKMFGNYSIDQGIYKFSLQEVIRKDFTIDEGSTIVFNGAPLDATLDIDARYTVNSVSLNDLMPNAGTLGLDQTNVKVDCLMNISGQLTSPGIKMDLEFPNERDEVQTIVRSYITTDEEMSMQILYLLSIGKFYASESAGGTQNSDVMSSVLSSTLSGQLSNALSNIIDNNNWNVGTNLSTGERGWTDVEFEGMLSGQLLNNRLLINGNFGYRDNPLSNTNFVGDFEAEWLVNRSGTIRLKAYNETNDRYYTRTNLTTQGIGIIFKKDFNKWSELLFWNRWKLRRLKQRH